MKSYLIISVLFFLLGCKQPASKTDEPIKIEDDYNRIIEIANAYNPYERKGWLPYNSSASVIYPLDDSLNNICKNLNPDSLLKDSNYRNAFIFLCEKFYLSEYRASKRDKNDFTVYNAAVWDTDLFWLKYCLNVLTNKKKGADKTIEDYAQMTSDWVFVEYIIAEGERNKDKISDSNFLKIHDSCIAIYPKVRDSLQLYSPIKNN